MILQMVKITGLISVIAFSSTSLAAKRYGTSYCHKSGYHCITVKKGETWDKLFGNSRTVEVVQKLNRMNTRLYPGLKIAVPDNLRGTDVSDISPFPSRRNTDTAMILIDQSKFAWGAYSKSGKLLNWGPISGGKNYCADVKRGCRTIKGEYKIVRKKGASCVSSKFPLGRGGAPMPYCMFFHRGYAMHGSNTVPGYNASHGCVRMFTKDAKWLNTNFVNVGKTKIIIR